MLGHPRPKHSLATYLFLFAAFCFVLGACSPQEAGTTNPRTSKTNAYTLEAPDLIYSLEDGAIEKISARQILSRGGHVPGVPNQQAPLAISTKIPLDTKIVFSQINADAKLAFWSQCAESSFSGEHSVQKNISVSSLLPPTHLSKVVEEGFQAPCTLQILIRFPSGATHEFTLENLVIEPLQKELALFITVDKTSTNTPSANSAVTNKTGRLKILCGSWWTKESPQTAQESSRAQLSLTARLVNLAKQPVTGTDDRARRWNPSCLVFVLDEKETETYIGQAKPLQQETTIVIEEYFPRSSFNETLRGNLFAIWKISNPNKTPQIVQLPAWPSQLNYAAIFRGRSLRPNQMKTSYEILVDAGNEYKTVSGSTFAFLKAQSSITIKLIANYMWGLSPKPQVCNNGRDEGDHSLVIQQARLSQPLLLQQLHPALPLEEFRSLNPVRVAELLAVNTTTLLDHVDLINGSLLDYYTRAPSSSRQFLFETVAPYGPFSCGALVHTGGLSGIPAM